MSNSSKTMIRVKHRENPYVMIDKAVINDPRLSWKAKGLMSYLLALPDDWKIYVNELKKHAADGRDGTASGIKELMKYGYCTREINRDERGLLRGYLYSVYELPSTESGFNIENEGVQPETGNPYPVKPYPENPKTDKPNTENPKLLNNDLTKEPIELNNDYTDESIYQYDGVIDFMTGKAHSRSDDIEYEIRSNRGIPYSFKADRGKMTRAIHILTNWDSYSIQGYHEESKQEIYKLFMVCLIDMACMDGVEKYKGSAVTYAKVIDMINQRIDWSYGLLNIMEFVHAFVFEFDDVSRQQEIRAVIPYMKSCIWNSLLTYKVKLNALEV